MENKADGSSINDIKAKWKGFCDDCITLVLKSVTMGEGLPIIIQISVTSLMILPLHVIQSSSGGKD